jgi:hypothetical protein
MSTQKLHEAGAPETEVEAAHEDYTQHETHRGGEPFATLPDAGNSNSHHSPAPSRLISAGQWMREVTGFTAPFGHDGLPTVWG